MKKSVVAIALLLSLIFCVTISTQPLMTTTIGSFPKPAYVTLPDWFQQPDSSPSKAYDRYLRQAGKDTVATLDWATQDVVKKQVSLGIDIPTDGEVRRENYIFYFCRHLASVDFNTLTQKQTRNGVWTAQLPTITQRITPCSDHFLVRDYQVAQQATTNPIKITIPGPMTITDSLANSYYENEEQLGHDLALAINVEIKALFNAGCRVIQIDEPIFARKAAQALTYGIKNLEACFVGIGPEVMKVVHICCGYPMHLDQTDYEKADPGSYALLAPALDNCCVDAISIEDAHRRNDPSLLSKFKHKKVILGVIDVSRSRIETVDEIEQHIRQALMHIDADRLLIAPDCGLGFLSLDMIQKKLNNMAVARNRILAQ